jgi:hypothetical protein
VSAERTIGGDPLLYAVQRTPDWSDLTVGEKEGACSCGCPVASGGEAAEARHDAEGAMAERNATQGELDDIADLLGIAKDPPHGAVRDAVKRQRDSLAWVLGLPWGWDK